MGGLATAWDIRDGRKLAQLDPPSRGVHAISLAYSPATGNIALGTRDGTILITQLEGEEFTATETLLSHVGRVNDLAFSKDGKYMASAGQDKSVLIWDMETRQEIGRLDSDGDISDLEVFSQQRSLIIAGDDVAVWQFLSEDEALALSEDKAIGQWLGTSAIYALQAGLLFTGLGGGLATHDPQNCGRFVTVSPDGGFLVDVKPSPLTNKVTVLDIEKNEILQQVDVKNAICDVEFTADGTRLVLAGDGGVFLVDVASWTLMPLYMMVDGFAHAPRVVLAEPKKMGLDVTGHALAKEAASETIPPRPEVAEELPDNSESPGHGEF
jgi:WD40 repeat protein